MGIFDSIFGSKPKPVPAVKIEQDVPQGFKNMPDLAGSFLVWQFVGNESGWWGARDRIEAHAAPYPPDLQPVVRMWIMYYLAWIFRLAFAGKYGNGATAEMMDAAYARLGRSDAPEIQALIAGLRMWTAQLDEAGKSAQQNVTIGQHKDIELPATYYATLRFMALDPDSPNYGSREVDGPLSDKVMMTLSEVHDEFLERVTAYAQKPSL